MKKICTISFLGLLIAILFGCSSKNEEELVVKNKETVIDENSSDLEYIASAKTPITLTMFNNIAEGDTNWGEDIMSKEIQKATGVSLEITHPISSDNQKINLLLASGKNIPDFIVFESVKNPALQKMINVGMAYDMNELIDLYAPKMKSMPVIAENRRYYEVEDKMYFLPTVSNDMSHKGDGVTIGNYAGYVIRDDLYKELGSPKIDTPEELKKVLLKVKEKYPNIVAPYLISYPNDYNLDQNGILTNYYSFGGTGKYFKNGNKIEYYIRDQRFFDSMLFLNDLYRNDLIQMSNFTESDLQVEKKLADGETFFISGGIYLGLDYQNTLREKEPKATYEVVKPVLYPDVSEFLPPGPNVVSDSCRAIVITKECKDPARAIRFLEYLATDEGQAMAVVGRKGIDYDMGGPGGLYYVPKGERKDIAYDMEQLSKTYGYLKYAWVGFSYPNSAYSWGIALDDPQRMRVRKYQAQFTDYAEYEGIAPVAGSMQDVIRVKVDDLIKVYVPKIVLANDEKQVKKMYQELIDKANKMKLAELEDLFTKNYHGNKK